MKTIIDDPEDFFDNGGWSFLDANSGDEAEGDEEEDEEDDVYNPSDSEDEYADDSGSDFSEESAVSEDVDSDGIYFVLFDTELIISCLFAENSLASGEESGKDWSELEEEAAQADRNGDFVDENAKKRNIPAGRKNAPKRRAEEPHRGSTKKVRKN